MKFNFSNLEATEFENLCRDLISEIEDKEFKIYARGKDQGIDFKWEEGSIKIIGQAKHYLNSNKASLISAVKKEKIKLKKSKPTKYIFMTSYDTTSEIEDEIFEILTPYLKSRNDIYGLSKIDNLLGNHKEVLHKNYKLWFTNIEILEELRNKARNQDIEIEIERILEKKDLYVQTPIYIKAIKILENRKFLLITGEPGVGKTSLAEMLVLKYLDSSYKLKFVASQDIKDLKTLLNLNKEDKEVIFIDDFLGANYLKYFQGNDEGEELVDFFKDLNYYRNKYIILTSRITILNKAYQVSEKLNREKKENYHIKITDYSKEVKAKILFNHLKFLNLNQIYINELLKNKNYKTIITHSNYYPRIIEFICKPINYNSQKYNSYFDFVIKSLNAPNEIWKMAFENNLKKEDKYFLRVLFSFNGETSKQKLKIAYEKRLEEENIKVDADSFQLTLRHLVDGFIKILEEKAVIKISFLNPSIMDFMLERYGENRSEILNELKASNYEEQVLFLLNQTLKKIKDPKFLKIMIEKIDEFEFENIGNKLKLLEDIFCKQYQKILEEKILEIIKFIITERIQLKGINIYTFLDSIHSTGLIPLFVFKSKYYEHILFSEEFKKKLLEFLIIEPNITEKLIEQLKDEDDVDTLYELLFEDIKVYDFEEKLEDFERKITNILENKYIDLNLEEKAYNLIDAEYNIEEECDLEKLDKYLKDNVRDEVQDLKNSFESFLSSLKFSDEEDIENYLYELEDSINDSLEMVIEDSISEIWIDWEEIQENVKENIIEDLKIDLEDFSNINTNDDWEKIDSMFDTLKN